MFQGFLVEHNIETSLSRVGSDAWEMFSLSLSSTAITRNVGNGFRAREAWRKHKAWGVSPRTITFEFLAREGGGSGNKREIVDEINARTNS